MPEQNKSPEASTIYYDQRSVALRTTQHICFVQEHDKMALFSLIMAEHKDVQTIVVVKSKKKADALATLLLSKEIKAQSIHGNHRKEQQQKAESDFNAATLQVIITTDMIYKTLVLENIRLVLSYDLPKLVQVYYNRLAFMNELGKGIAFVNPEDEPCLDEIEYNMKKELKELEVKGFKATPKPTYTNKSKKNRSNKPRYRKNKEKKEESED